VAVKIGLKDEKPPRKTHEIRFTDVQMLKKTQFI